MEKPKCRGMEKYTGYATRSEKTRNPERMSHGNVAKKRYKMIDRSGLKALGQGRTAGHQNRRPVARKDACSTRCHDDCIPTVNSAGTCHPIKAAQAAIQQN